MAVSGENGVFFLIQGRGSGMYLLAVACSLSLSWQYNVDDDLQSIFQNCIANIIISVKMRFI